MGGSWRDDDGQTLGEPRLGYHPDMPHGPPTPPPRRCAHCGMELRDDQGVGSGRLEDGIYCDLDCYARANGLRFEVAQRSVDRTPPH
jgi:hypothetical protein